MAQLARSVLAPQFAEAVERSRLIFFQPIVDLESPRLAFGRIAIVGDAAFTARPHVAMGVPKAAGDVLSLAAALAFATWLAGARARPLAVVVGSMLELGPESDRLHAESARTIAAVQPSLIGAVGRFAPAFETLGARGTRFERLLVAPDADTLGPLLRTALRGNEVVLLKASRGVALERVLRHLR